MPRRFYALGFALTLAGLPGCYTYRVEPATALRPDTPVRARLTPAAAERLSTTPGTDDRLLEGRVLQSGTGGLLLEVPSVGMAEPGAIAAPRLHTRVTLEPADVVEVEVRRLNRGRTAAAIALGAGIAAAIVASQFGDQGNGQGGPGKPPIDRILVPLLQLR